MGDKCCWGHARFAFWNERFDPAILHFLTQKNLKLNMFENFENPTEFDYELIKILYRYMTKEERQAFATTIQKSFSQNDLIATKELAKTIMAVKMEI